MAKTGRRVAVLGGGRTPFVKSFGPYKRFTNQDLLTAVLSDLTSRFKLKNKQIGDVALGSVIHHSTDWNLAREVVLGSGLARSTPAYNLQRACGTGLEAFVQVALKIQSGQIEAGIAGGSDTNSDTPFFSPRSLSWALIEAQSQRSFFGKAKVLAGIRLRDLIPRSLEVREPRTGLSMGEHCELMVKEWNVNREDQDTLALQSHRNAARAYLEGFFDGLLIEFNGVKRDSILRSDSTMEKLNALRPAFGGGATGTLTAGNSSSLTDGASAVLLCSEEYAESSGWEPLAYFVDAHVAAVDFVGGDGLLMAPTIAVAELLKRNQLRLQDFDYYEIHEAFAGQVLCTLKAWENAEYCRKNLGATGALGSIDRDKINVKGGSLALGHPFAATGGRIVASLAKLLKTKGKGRGLISICTAGGMGVAAILEA